VVLIGVPVETDGAADQESERAMAGAELVNGEGSLVESIILQHNIAKLAVRYLTAARLNTL